MRIAMTLLALSLSLTACKKKGDEPPATGSGSAMGSDPGSGSAAAGSGSAMAGSATGSGSAMAGSGSGSTMAGSAGSGSDAGSASANAGSGSGSGDAAMAMAHKAGMCPSTVFGATTKVAVVKGISVEVTITSDDKDAIIAIQKRTTESLKEKIDSSGSKSTPGHDQKGTHGGGLGLCPVHVPEGASATSKNIAKGVVVNIAPKDPKGSEALKTEIDGRIAKSADWVKANIKPGDAKNQGGDGGGKGPHGSNHTGNGDGTGKDKKAGSGSAKK